MNFFDEVAVRFDVVRRAREEDPHAVCVCGDSRMMHQFDEHHDGTCTRSRCSCRRFDARGRR